jgi:integrase
VSKPRRRQAGEGGISEYATKAGPRFLIKYAAPDEDGGKRWVLKRGFATRRAAAAALREQLSKIADGTHVRPNKITVGEHLAEWLDGLRLAPSTIASYHKNVRLHVEPHIGALRLDQLTGARLTKLYRQLEESGRVDSKGGGLSARTVRYIHTIIHKGLAVAVRDGRLAVNPADKADPPSAKAAKAPEMHPWTDGQLRAFLGWARASDDMYVAWRLLAMTGMRRGEALALQWRDIDFDAGTIAVRRAATLVKTKGQPERIVIDKPKSGKERVVDVDDQTLAALRAHRKTIGTLSLPLAREDAYVLGTVEGTVRHPERFSLAFKHHVARARTELGHDTLPEVRLHDLRHSHATILLKAGEPVKVVSERLGHASPMITLTVYAHVLPTMQRAAATRFAAMVDGGA